MPARTGQATWQGGLKTGKGHLKLGSGAFSGGYSFATRFESAAGTNPEELIASAHAACFSMALSFLLEQAGHPPQRVDTTAEVSVEKVEKGFKITRIHLHTIGTIPGLDAAQFQQFANQAKSGCPVSQALATVPIELDATLAT